MNRRHRKSMVVIRFRRHDGPVRIPCRRAGDRGGAMGIVAVLGSRQRDRLVAVPGGGREGQAGARRDGDVGIAGRAGHADDNLRRRGLGQLDPEGGAPALGHLDGGRIGDDRRPGRRPGLDHFDQAKVMVAVAVVVVRALLDPDDDAPVDVGGNLPGGHHLVGVLGRIEVDRLRHLAGDRVLRLPVRPPAVQARGEEGQGIGGVRRKVFEDQLRIGRGVAAIEAIPDRRHRIGNPGGGRAPCIGPGKNLTDGQVDAGRLIAAVDQVVERASHGTVPGIADGIVPAGEAGQHGGIVVRAEINQDTAHGARVGALEAGRDRLVAVHDQSGRIGHAGDRPGPAGELVAAVGDGRQLDAAPMVVEGALGRPGDAAGDGGDRQRVIVVGFRGNNRLGGHARPRAGEGRRAVGVVAIVLGGRQGHRLPGIPVRRGERQGSPCLDRDVGVAGGAHHLHRHVPVGNRREPHLDLGRRAFGHGDGIDAGDDRHGAAGEVCDNVHVLLDIGHGQRIGGGDLAPVPRPVDEGLADRGVGRHRRRAGGAVDRLHRLPGKAGPRRPVGREGDPVGTPGLRKQPVPHRLGVVAGGPGVMAAGRVDRHGMVDVERRVRRRVLEGRSAGVLQGVDPVVGVVDADRGVAGVVERPAGNVLHGRDVGGRIAGPADRHQGRDPVRMRLHVEPGVPAAHAQAGDIHPVQVDPVTRRRQDVFREGVQGGDARPGLGLRRDDHRRQVEAVLDLRRQAGVQHLAQVRRAVARLPQAMPEDDHGPLTLGLGIVGLRQVFVVPEIGARSPQRPGKLLPGPRHHQGREGEHGQARHAGHETDSGALLHAVHRKFLSVVSRDSIIQSPFTHPCQRSIDSICCPYSTISGLTLLSYTCIILSSEPELRRHHDERGA